MKEVHNMEIWKSVFNILKDDIKYLYLKKLPKSKYESFLKTEYKHRTGEDLNMNPPETYTEKMQYAKLYLNTPLKTKLSDKYEVREWIDEKIGSDYLIPLLGVWDNYSDIDFDKMPNRFVLKLNSGSGTNIIVKDKNKLNHKRAKMKFDRWIRKNFAYSSDLQPHYEDIEPKIIAEEFIQDSEGELKEFKFFCFDGQPYYCWVLSDEENDRFGDIYDLNWVKQPWNFEGGENFPTKRKEPENFQHMIEIAKKLSEDFSHVRVDLYSVDNKIYFGEMTFTSSGGYRLILPNKYNRNLGELWNLTEEI